MPRRRKPTPEEVKPEELLALPPALPIRGPHKHHEHQRDPYESPPGGVPNPKTIGSRPIDRELTEEDIQNREISRILQRAEVARYRYYLDALTESEGDKVKALAKVFDVTINEARERQEELHDEVCRGRGKGTLAQMLLDNDLDLPARVARLRTWVYADNAPASLNAIRLLGELDDETGDVGSFEQFLRLSKEQLALQQKVG